MRVLLLTKKYAIIDGISMVLHDYLLNSKGIECDIVTRYLLDCQDDIKPIVVNSENDLKRIITSANYDVIHYFKGSGYDLFNWARNIVESEDLNIPIVTTVCQRPSYPTLLLSPDEIRYSDKIVFIDKQSYKDPLYPFIPEEKKTVIYFGCPQSHVEETGELLSLRKEHNCSDKIIFGRGSTISKCPPDMLEIFNDIPYKDKKFRIVGVSPNSWVGEKAKALSDVEVIPPVKYRQWLEYCNDFDIFLYQIPRSSHASIDGTLGDAMLLEKPVVYYGSEAPKERLEHGVNGFIATTEEEFIKYADILANNPKLREEMGKKARETTIRDFHIDVEISKYYDIYKDSAAKGHNPMPVDIPNSYKKYFISKMWKRILKDKYSGSCIESLYHRLKPVR